MCAVCADKMSAYEMYSMIRNRQSSLSELKKSYSSSKAQLDYVIGEMAHKGISNEMMAKANSLRKIVEESMREIKAIEICSRSIANLEDSFKNKSVQKKSFKDCVTEFMEMKGSTTFEFTELAKFVSDKRDQAMTNSMRVFTHRVLRDLLMQNQVKQVAHGLYSSNIS